MQTLNICRNETKKILAAMKPNKVIKCSQLSFFIETVYLSEAPTNLRVDRNG